MASRKPEACAEAETHLRSVGGEALGVPTHLGRLEGLDSLVSQRVETFEVNLRGPVFLTQKALPHLTTSPNAAVLNVVSVGAFIFSPYISMYSDFAPHGNTSMPSLPAQ